MKQSSTLFYLGLTKVSMTLMLLLVIGWLPLSSYAQTWQQQSISTAILNGVWGTDASNVWTAGGTHTIMKWNGSTWSAQISGNSQVFNGIWGADANNIWVVGTDFTQGTILKWNGSTWSAQTSGTTSTLNSVWGANASNIWAVGINGTIQKWNGSAWLGQTSNTTAILRSVWGANANNVWAVGNSGTILKWNGSAWSAQTSNTTQTLRGVWGTDANNVWAVGNSGTILKWNGSAWSAQTSNTTQTLLGVWGIDAYNVWAVGGGGTILKWDGLVWSAQNSGNSQTLRGIWGANAGNIWAVGDVGTVLYSNDQPITSLPVELINFQVKKQSENTALLLWHTASETNNLGWDIERSTDGRQWQGIGFRAGNGTTSESQAYTFTDEQPSPGQNYYRLRQSDHNGQYEYSPVVQVMMPASEGQTGAFFPNPAHQGLVSLQYDAEKEGDLHVSVFDAHGRLMIHQNQSVAAARNRLQFDFSTLSPGTYSVLLDNGTSQVTRMLTIQ